MFMVVYVIDREAVYLSKLLSLESGIIVIDIVYLLSVLKLDEVNL